MINQIFHDLACHRHIYHWYVFRDFTQFSMLLNTRREKQALIAESYTLSTVPRYLPRLGTLKPP